MGWLLIVAGHQTNLFWLILPVIVIYLWFEQHKKRISGRIYIGRLLLILVGFSLDLGLSQLELIEFGESTNVIPVWLFLLWCWFALNFSDSFSWLKNKRLFATGLGGIFGPLAYFGASKIADVSITEPVYFSLLSSLFWGVLFFLIFSNKGLEKYFLKTH